MTVTHEPLDKEEFSPQAFPNINKFELVLAASAVANDISASRYASYELDTKNNKNTVLALKLIKTNKVDHNKIVSNIVNNFCKARLDQAVEEESDTSFSEENFNSFNSGDLSYSVEYDDGDYSSDDFDDSEVDIDENLDS